MKQKKVSTNETKDFFATGAKSYEPTEGHALCRIQSVDLYFKSVWFCMTVTRSVLNELTKTCSKKYAEEKLRLYNLRDVKSTRGGVLLIVKLQASACMFTKSSTPPLVFWSFFNCSNGIKLLKASQVSRFFNIVLPLNPRIVFSWKLTFSFFF